MQSKTWSLVWDYFTINDTDDSMVCNECGVSFLNHRPATARNHLKAYHNETYIELTERENIKKPKIEAEVEEKLSPQETFDHFLAVFLSKNNIPISILGDLDFHNVLNAYNEKLRVGVWF